MSTDFLGEFRALVVRNTKKTSWGFPYRAAAVPKGVEPLPVKGTTGGDYDTAWSRRLPALAHRRGTDARAGAQRRPS